MELDDSLTLLNNIIATMKEFDIPDIATLRKQLTLAQHVSHSEASFRCHALAAMQGLQDLVTEIENDQAVISQDYTKAEPQLQLHRAKHDNNADSAVTAAPSVTDVDNIFGNADDEDIDDEDPFADDIDDDIFSSADTATDNKNTKDNKDDKHKK